MPLSKLLISVSSKLDRRYGWDKLPLPIGVLTLIGLRTRLREENLYDTGESDAKPDAADGSARAARTTRRELERPLEAGDGADRPALRPQRAAREDLPRAGAAAARAEPAPRQPRSS